MSAKRTRSARLPPRWLTWPEDTKTVTAKGKDLAASILQDAVGKPLQPADVLDKLDGDPLEGGQDGDSLVCVFCGFKVLLLLEFGDESFAESELLVGREARRHGRRDAPLASSCHVCDSGDRRPRRMG